MSAKKMKKSNKHSQNKAKFKPSKKNKLKLKKVSSKKASLMVKTTVKAGAKKKEAPKIKKSKKELEIERKELELKARKEAYARELERIHTVLSHSFARQAIVNLAGENSLEIIKSFETNLSDDEIAKKLKLKISDVRATLNKLHGEGLVSYFRDKNNETGWYSYTWAANGEKIEFWIKARIEERKLAAGSGEDEQYFCPGCGINAVHDFETATNISFKCQICNKNLEFLDDNKREELISGKRGRE